MTRRLLVMAVVCATAFLALSIPACGAESAASGAPSEAAAAAVRFANGLAAGDLRTGYQLLSSDSKKRINGVQWEEAYRTRSAARMPSGNDLLRALAAGEEPPTVGEALLEAGEALVPVSGVVRVTEQLVLVKEGGAWLVDLAASDKLNSREAAEVFVEAVASGSPTPRAVRAPDSAGPPMLRAVMATEAKDFHVLDESVSGDRAEVTLACDVPVSVVLRVIRSGAGWTVDFTRPLVNTSPTSPDPLKEAAQSNLQATCQDQLRQLGQALQMYAAANNDTYPDPSHWVERIRPFVGESASLHCPADRTPGISYAMNKNLVGKKRSMILNASTTPVLYESALHSANPTDTGQSWPAQALHAAGNMVLYADGSVRPTTAQPSFVVTEGIQPPPAAGRPQPQGRRQPGNVQIRPAP
ncbi:MAG: hypothetical protein ACE149_06035 [Armatimonadota bacterium]